ncbi:MAG: calcium-translocating P-type ATPase, PMCA-type [Defluviitaleaceae bacterium]|nr:calcium-translocating P-type ATPase, PMCA-type [Defluviitaleaceae bacterium]
MFYNNDYNKALKTLNTDEKYGLKSNVIKNIQLQYGKNKLEDAKKINILVKFFSQFNDFMIFILLLAAIISFVIGIEENDYLDSIIIVFIIIFNAVLGLIQENKAEKALDALKSMSQPKSKVIRDGSVSIIDTEELVPGDIILLEPGTMIPADARLIESHNLRIDESALTGESMEVDKDYIKIIKKDAPLGDRINMVYSGTNVSAGKGKAVVTATSMDTEIGKIAKMVGTSVPETPLQKRLEKTGKLLGIGAIIVCTIIFFIGVFQNIPIFNMFMTSVSLAVAAIPEGLPAIVTITLALGVLRMAKRKSIIRKLPAVETLGSATIICSDKTGTLTQNKMKVVEINSIHPLKSIDEQRKMILEYANLCNDATMENEENIIGNPTEIALVRAGIISKIDKNKLESMYPRVGQIPFDSSRKLMTTIHRTEKGFLSITKGAPDYILKNCNTYYDKKVLDITKNSLSIISHQNKEMAKKALRVIGISYKFYEYMPKIDENLEQNLTFLGFLGIIDPPRKEAYEAVDLCKKAKIKPVMITGDHIDTAVSIAKDLGIMKLGDLAITGNEIDEIGEENLKQNIEKYSVFARVNPMHKMSIVKAYQNKGHVVAMTGDGVNDAPALKAADIGCAMGTGTDVAKGAADMILVDDNFATIVEAVEEGRGIYQNIKKAIHFLLSSNIGEIVAILVSLVLGWQTPLLAIHLLWINLVTDSLPAIALGLEKAEKSIMLEPPQNVKNSFFADGLWQRIVLEGIMIGILSVIAFGIGKVYFDSPYSFIVGRTMAFATLSISQLIHAFNVRTSKSIIGKEGIKNKYLVMAFLIGLLLQMIVILSPLHRVFRVIPLNIMQWSIVFCLSLVPIIVIEIQKAFNSPTKILNKKEMIN